MRVKEDQDSAGPGSLGGFGNPLRDQLAIAQLITEHAADAIFLLDGEGRTTFANPAAEAMFGWAADELQGKVLHDLIHYKRPDGSPFPMTECPLGNVFASGRSLRLHEDLFFRKDGSPIPVACSNAAVLGDGGVAGGVLIVRDISERQESERQRQLLLGELNHRVKNTLAVVQSIAHQSFKGGDLQASRAAFEGRLAALSRAHDLLTETNWTSAPLTEVVARALLPFAGEERIEIAGPEVTLPPKACLSVAIGIHELATNAAKYGALSADGGRVSVTWDVRPGDDGPTLHLLWAEAGGPLVRKPEGRGFGSRMIEALAAELHGRVTVSFDPEGLRCTLEAPVPPQE